MSSNCSPIQRADYRGACDQEAVSLVESLIEKDLDQCIDEGEYLKDGNSATVVTVDSIVIKRYNNKSSWHAFKRRLKPTRAFRSWQSARRLLAHGLNTPEPIAYLDRHAKFPWLRGPSYYIAKFHSSPSISEMPNESLINEEVGEKLAQLIGIMRAEKVVHGDFKASNFLWDKGRLFLIDLDAMKWDLSSRAFEKAHHKDIARLKANWPQGSFREHLDALISS